tara:strand:+ start:449 stop:736 length:288 start_codon:yes stop_codon:yes gene_type:complete
MEMKNMAYWKAKNAASVKKSPLEKELVGKQHNLPEQLKAKIEAAPESPTKFLGLALGAAKAIGGAIKGHKDRKDALKREAAGAAGRAVANMPKFG